MEGSSTKEVGVVLQMNKIFLILLFLLSGCAGLSKQEWAVVGTWSWQHRVGEFEDSGHVTLNSNRTHSYEIKHRSTTELLGEVYEPGESYWRLLSSGAVSPIAGLGQRFLPK